MAELNSFLGPIFTNNIEFAFEAKESHVPKVYYNLQKKTCNQEEWIISYRLTN
jgi:hypothetical protein